MSNKKRIPFKEVCISLGCHRRAVIKGLCRECEEIRQLTLRRGYFDSRDLALLKRKRGDSHA